MSNRHLARHHRLRLLSGIAVVALVAGTAATAGAATTSVHRITTTVAPVLSAPKSDIRYAVNTPLCATRAKPGDVTCFAMRRVTVKKGTPGALPYVSTDSIGHGPAGGFAPADLAAAYRFNPKLARSGQTVGIVDWFDDPKVRSDLDTFDKHYGLHQETASSFRKLNQIGTASPLPDSTSGKGSAPEIALDVETVRGVCNTCKILLIEAAQPSDHDLAIAENTAVRLGATEVSNSFGGPEDHETATTLAGFNHPGVVITASTGDDGWFGWDGFNNDDSDCERAQSASDETPSFPASDPDVVAVGGTKLALSSTGAITGQSVWNENGLDDREALSDGCGQGAGGSGCSTEYQAKPWQLAATGESHADCGTRRSSADVALDADPETGFDVYDTWGIADHPGHNWFTVGGTSLSSPMLSAMWALAGGSGGAEYPSRSLYTNALNDPAALLDDITDGGNGFCGGDDTADCGSFVDANTSPATHNPNALGAGDLDCSFPRFVNGTAADATDPAKSAECNATKGYDGPTGVGAPASPSLLTSTSPTAAIVRRGVVRLHHAATFTARAAATLSGTHLTGYKFQWGDGKVSSTTTPTAKHSYTKKGHYTLTLTVTDSAGQQSISRSTVTVGEALHLKLFGTAKIKHGKTDRFSADVTDPNSGGKVKKVAWHWGDGHSSTGVHARHSWHSPGTYKITIVITDTTGITTRFVAKQKVT